MTSTLSDRVQQPERRDERVARQRSRGRAAAEIVLFSLAVSALAGVVAAAAALTTDARFALVFVVLRWLLVAALLTTPLVHQAAVRWGASWRLPWALRTPVTALVLTIESICFDIMSARLS